MATFTGSDADERFDGDPERRNTAFMGGGMDIAFGGDLYDALYGEAGNDELHGGGGEDRLDGGTGDDTIFGESGDDTIVGGLGIDQLFGGQGDDEIAFASGAFVDGGAGDDVLTGTITDLPLFATLFGGAGDDEIRIRTAIHGTFDGGAGEDTINYLFLDTANGVTVDLLRGYGGGDAAGDSYVRIEDAIGADGDDTLIGNGGVNALNGYIGNDVLSGGGAGDYLDGSTGTDTASYLSSSAGVAVDLGARTAFGGDAQEDILVSIEGLWGSEFRDTLTGDDAANELRGAGGDDSLQGAGGNDLLVGQGGDDRLTGGADADRLTGGAGADTFVFLAVADSTPGAGRDRINDFNRAEHDRIDLRQIDADPSTAGDQAFRFVGAAAFSGVAGELRVTLNGAQFVVSADVDGDKVADFQLTVGGDTSQPLAATDFVL